MNRSSKGTILRSMAIFTAIELGGSIIRGKTGRNTTRKNFLKFCNKYMPDKYHKVSELLYSIFRCGVAHSYTSKGAALLSSNHYDKKKHLVFYKNGLFIYIPELSADVSHAIRLLYEVIKRDNNLKRNYEFVITTLDNDGLSEFQTFVKKHDIKTKKSKIKRDITTDII